MNASRLAASSIAFAVLSGLLAGCSAGAGPGIDDPQPSTPEAKFIDRAHESAPETKHMPDAQIVRVGRTFCKQALLLTFDRPSTDSYVRGVSAETMKGEHHFTPTEVRRVIIDSATLCPRKMQPAMRFLRAS